MTVLDNEREKIYSFRNFLENAKICHFNIYLFSASSRDSYFL